MNYIFWKMESGCKVLAVRPRQYLSSSPGKGEKFFTPNRLIVPEDSRWPLVELAP